MNKVLNSIIEVSELIEWGWEPESVANLKNE